MNDFLSCWIASFPAALTRLLGTEVRMSYADQLPPPDGSICAALVYQGEWSGTVTLAAPAAALAELFTQRKKGAESTSGQPTTGESPTVSASWLNLLRSTEGGLAGCELDSVREGARAAAVPVFAIELQCESFRMLLAVSASVERATPAPPPHTEGKQPEPDPSAASRPADNLDLLLDLEVDASLRFGARELPLHEVLELGPGDVVELDRQVAEAVDLIVGDKIIGRGEVVLVNGNFGLRVTEVAEPTKRLESVRCLF